MDKVYKIISNINTIIVNPIIFILLGLAVFYFVLGVFQYLWKSRSDPAQVKIGASHMAWGIFGIFIMISVFGLFKFLINSIPVSDTTKENVNRVLDIN